MADSSTYKIVGIFSEGLTQTKSNEKYGFINEMGEVIIPCVYENTGHFRYGLAWVQINGKEGYIDKKGNMVIPPIFYAAWLFDEIFDSKGKIKIFAKVQAFKNSKILYIDKDFNYYDFKTKKRIRCGKCPCLNDKIVTGLCCRFRDSD